MRKEKKIFLQDYGGNLGRAWYVEFYDAEGNRRRVSGGMNREKTAAARYAVAERIIQDIGAESVARNTGIFYKEFEKAVLSWIETNRHAWRKKTVQSYTSKCTIFLDWIKENRVKSFDVDAAAGFEKFLRGKVSKSTFNEYIRILGVIFAAVFPGQENFFQAVKKYQGETKTPALYFQAYQRKRIAALLQEKEPNLYFFIQFIFYAFIRPGELRQMKVSDILIEDNKILVRAEIAKNKRRQFVQIPLQLRAAILESGVLNYSENMYLFTSSGRPGPVPAGSRFFASRHQALIRAAGFDTEKYKLYSWKHTGAVACCKAGMKLKDLQLQMRHASIEETDGYLRSLGINDAAADIVNIFPEL